MTEGWLPEMIHLVHLVGKTSAGEQVVLGPTPTDQQENEADAWLLAWLEGRTLPLNDPLRETILWRLICAGRFLTQAAQSASPRRIEEAPRAATLRAVLVDQRETLRLILRGLTQDEQN